jgi:type I restriction enzyme S subunit
MPSLNQDILSRFPITLLPVADQKAIAHILGTLDDKIELNRKTNETLEAMAKALFKSWFVDFDPVRAKAEGRPTGLPAEISDLFPDSFEDSELGEIPSGWRVTPVGDVVECVGGSTPSTSEADYWDGGEYFWATPKDLSSLSEPFLLDTAKKITADGVQRISSGILPVGTVLLSSRAPVGYVAAACVPVSINQGFIAFA